MYHNVLIHSSADGYLGCFHVLVIVNSAAVNVGVHVSFNSGFLGVYAQQWDCWVICMLILLINFSWHDLSVAFSFILTQQISDFWFQKSFTLLKITDDFKEFVCMSLYQYLLCYKLKLSILRNDYFNNKVSTC